jgi:guanidinopropionase
MVDLKKKLDDLRTKFADSAEFFDPRFRRVAEKIFKGGTRAAPYSGISTFASLPYKEVNFADPDFGDLQVAAIGIPMDLGVSNRPGSRFGPRAVRGIERIGPTIMSSTAHPFTTCVPQTSATCRLEAAIGWNSAIKTSRR